MSESSSTPVAPRRRRWYQFSLRGLLLLTAAVASWLIYHARQHAVEEAVVAQARELDPKATGYWHSPGWWRWMFDERPSGIFERMNALTIQGQELEADQVAALHVERLSAIQCLSIFDSAISDEESDDLRAHWNKNLEISISNSFFSTGEPLKRGSVDQYLANPTPLEAKLARASVLSYARFMKRVMSQPEQLAYGCFRVGDAGEDNIAKLFKAPDESMRVCGAFLLWKMHSKIYTQEIIDLAAALKPTTKEGRRLKERVEKAVSKEGLVAEINQGDQAWGSWLASKRPQPEVTQALMKAVKDGRATQETVYALGETKDRQVVPALVAALSYENLCGNFVVERALEPFGNEELETTLLAGLANCNEFYAGYGASVLGKIGTPRSIPTLEKLSTDPKYENASINVHNMASIAVGEIEQHQELIAIEKQRLAAEAEERAMEAEVARQEAEAKAAENKKP